jgi:putative membrane-bound dehydrogenase-like protein
MNITRRPSLVILFGFLGLCNLTLAPTSATAQGYPPGEAAGRMTVPEGLRVSLFASEPMIRQPSAIEFDDRGRLWVIQYLQYPNPAGLKRVAVDRFSRTVYDGVPKPPPAGPKGADRITILEDTDRDGIADRAKDFVAGLNLTSGLAFGHGGVFVIQVPYLLFYPDRNRDDVPDGDPEVLLTGFGMEDAHSVANSLTWGPDGWLYGLQGSTVTAKIRGIEFQQGLWRYHPLSKKFELFAEGGGNMWGLDFDPKGNAIACTNFGGFIGLHMVQGGYYWKQFGKHGPLHNPFTFGFFDHMKHKGGGEGHVAVGGFFYWAPEFPERFRGKFIAGDLLGHAVHWNRVVPRGSTFETVHEGDLLKGNDTWFAPTDLTQGPDGAIYVADWHDKRTAHPDPDADWDRTNGRIFRIAAIGSKPAPEVKLIEKSSADLVAELKNPNVWYVRKARRLLADRRDPSVIPLLKEKVEKGSSELERLEAFWALAVSGGFNASLAEALLSHRDADIRAWTVRLIGDDPQLLLTETIAEKLVNLTTTEPNLRVFSQLASTAKRLPDPSSANVVDALLLHDDDRHDPHLPLLIWWAIEGHANKFPDPTLWFADPEFWKLNFWRETILPRLIKRYAAEGTLGGDTTCATLLKSAPTPADRSIILASLDEGLRLRPSRGSKSIEGSTPESKELADTVAMLWKENRDDPTLTRLAAKLGDRTAIAYAAVKAGDLKEKEATRLSYLHLFDETAESPPVTTLLKLAESDPSPIVQAAAIDVLKRSDDSQVADTLIKLYAGKPEPWRAHARSVLLGRKPWAKLFLGEVDRGRLAAKEVPLDDLRAIALHKDKELDALVRKHWGGVSAGTPEEKLAEVRRLNNDVRAFPGNPKAGREVFLKTCATCHRFQGEGVEVGPDLTHANRSDRQFLLLSLVDPSAVVRKEFQSIILSTTDGRVLSGLLADQNHQSVTVVGAKNERTVVRRNLIDQIQDSPISLMPENLYKELSPENLRDLFTYLQP